MTDAQKSDEERLRHEVAGLAVPDILALCYAFSKNPDRLRLYLDVLRKKGGLRAQFASCLLCFDLGRQGFETFQREFALLMDTMRTLAEDQQLVENLVEGDPYLSFVWELCQAQLEEADERFDAEPALMPTDDVQDLGSLDLLSDDDFGDFGIPVDDAYLWLQFDEAVEAFLGGQLGRAIYDMEAGFRLKNKRDTERVERFLRELDSLHAYVPMARGFRALVMLFYATHMRSRSLFGTINERKQTLLREGIAEFCRSGQEMWSIVGVLNPIHAEPAVWEKISDVLEDYLAWLAEDPRRAALDLSHYNVVERMVERYAKQGWLKR